MMALHISPCVGCCFLSLSIYCIIAISVAWCKACKAVEGPFRRLTKEFPTVKFVEVPVTKDNAYLHQGLGIPSIPFGHIYQRQRLQQHDNETSTCTLVEERKMNKHVFAEFQQTLRSYVHGECPMVYDDDDDDDKKQDDDDDDDDEEDVMSN